MKTEPYEILASVLNDAADEDDVADADDINRRSHGLLAIWLIFDKFLHRADRTHIFLRSSHWNNFC